MKLISLVELGFLVLAELDGNRLFERFVIASRRYVVSKPAATHPQKLLRQTSDLVPTFSNCRSEINLREKSPAKAPSTPPKKAPLFAARYAKKSFLQLAGYEADRKKTFNNVVYVGCCCFFRFFRSTAHTIRIQHILPFSYTLTD